MSDQQTSQQFQIKPIVNYPREAQIGQTYLMTIDLQLASPDADWPYPDEEYPITFVLNTQPYFRYEPLNGDRPPGVVLHRFGGTYGPARYLLTASEQVVEPGHISITFVNGSGLPITRMELACSVNTEPELRKEQEISILRKELVSVGSENVLSSEGEESNSSEVGDRQEEIEEWPTSSGPVEGDFIEMEISNFALVGEQLEQAGWEIQNRAAIISTALRQHPGIAIRYHPLVPNGYLLLIEQELVGIVQVRPTGESLGGAEKSPPIETLSIAFSVERTARRSILPFIYESTGYETIFTNNAEPEPRSRTVFTFHRPETLQLWLQQAPPNKSAAQNDLLRSRLQRMPVLLRQGLREHQFEAIRNLENSLAQNRSHALIQMQPATGLTFTALNSMHRLLKYGGAGRILYAFDTPLALDYAINILNTFIPAGSTAQFIDRYTIDYLVGKTPNPQASVCLTTLEQLYTTFRSHISDSDTALQIDDGNINIRYNPAFPIEYFDVIVIANCDSALYQEWRSLIEYFDAFIIGITGIDDEQLLSLFSNNVVYKQDTDQPRTLILTSNPTEYKAVRTLMGKVDEITETDQGMIYRQSLFSSEQGMWRVGLALINNARTAFEIGQVIHNFNPSTILFVGVATGVRDVRPGDVVVATKVYCDEVFLIQPAIRVSNHHLIQQATTEARTRDWLRRLPQHERSLEPEPHVFIGPIATGEKSTAVESPTNVSTSHTRYNDVLAVEMESQDFLDAMNDNMHTQVIIIRGISDMIDKIEVEKVDTQKAQETAARHASAFAFEMLAKLNPEEFAHSDEAEQTPTACQILCLYSRHDERAIKQLTTHLAALKERHPVSWHEAAVEYNGYMKYLDNASLILMLLSADFLNWDSFWDNGLPQIMRKHESGEAVVIPIILRSVLWQDTPFNQLMALPRDGRAITHHERTRRERERINVEVAQEVEAVVEKLTKPTTDEAQEVVESFQAFLEQYRDRVATLEASLSRTSSNQPSRVVGQLTDDLRRYGLSLEKVWRAYWQLEPTLYVQGVHAKHSKNDMISLIDYARQRKGDHIAILEPFKNKVLRRFDDWLGEQQRVSYPYPGLDVYPGTELHPSREKPRFNEEQVKWLRRIRDRIISDLRFEEQDFDRSPFSHDGGLVAARALFGAELPSILDDLNWVLVNGD